MVANEYFTVQRVDFYLVIVGIFAEGALVQVLACRFFIVFVGKLHQLHFLEVGFPADDSVQAHEGAGDLDVFGHEISLDLSDDGILPVNFFAIEDAVEGKFIVVDSGDTVVVVEGELVDFFEHDEFIFVFCIFRADPVHRYNCL